MARELAVLMARNMVSNRTAMQERHGGHLCIHVYRNRIHHVQSQYEGNLKREGRATYSLVTATGRHICMLPLSRVIVLAMTSRDHLSRLARRCD